MLFDPERRWTPRAGCKDADTELFFSDSGHPSKRPSPKTQAAWDSIKAKYCKHCPVMQECRRDTLGELYGVWGGRDQVERSRIRSRLSKAVTRWPEEERLAWGKEMHRLRESGIVHRDIQRMTGIGEVPAAYLIKYWLEHLAAKEAAEPAPAPVADGVTRTKDPFPEVPGSRNCWVRNNGIVQDAFYRAETEEGDWIQVQLSNRGRRTAVIKWIPAEDVQIYSPQARVVRKRAPRVGGPKTKKKAEIDAAA